MEGVGFAGMAPIDGWQGRRARPGLLPELGNDLIGGVAKSKREGENAAYLFGVTRVGHGPVLELGRFGSLRPFSIFLISFHFSFLFSDLFQFLLQTCFKPIQAISQIIKIIKARF
jgi:hypothetical protein